MTSATTTLAVITISALALFSAGCNNTSAPESTKKPVNEDNTTSQSTEDKS